MNGIALTYLTKSSLTNLNGGEGQGNTVELKKYKGIDNEYHPFISGQMTRHAKKEMRHILNGDPNYSCLNEKGEGCGDIINCPDCDGDGYMNTKKGNDSNTRKSPVSVSPGIGLLPMYDIDLDFLTRKKEHEESSTDKGGDIVNVELNSNIYKFGMSIDVNKYGVDEKSKKLVISQEEKVKRICTELDAIRFMNDYSKQSRLMSDVTPDIIVLTIQDKLNHRLQSLFEIDENCNVNIELVNDILSEMENYSTIYVGMIHNVVNNDKKLRETFDEMGIEVTTPYEAIGQVINEVKKQCTE